MSTTQQKFDDIENTIENFRVPEDEEFLARIYEKNIEKINKISNIIQISQITGVCSFLIFLVLLAIRVNRNFSFSWFYLLTPALVCLVSYTVLVNMYLKLKDIFDQAEKVKEEEDVSQIGSIITYFSLNVISLNIFAYLVLFCLRVENIILSQWNLISIPLYITLGIALFYWIFIFPAFLQNKLYSEIIIIFIYISCSFVFFFLLNFRLDNEYIHSYFKIFIPLIFAFGFHLMYMLTVISESIKKGEMLKFFNNIGLTLSLLICAILTCLKADNTIHSYDYWLPVVIFIIGYLFFISDQLISTFFPEKEKEEDLNGSSGSSGFNGKKSVEKESL